MGSVMADMSDRRGLITDCDDTTSGKRFVAEVPVSECFGYSTVLRTLTRGRGRYTFEFSHYAPVGGNDTA